MWEITESGVTSDIIVGIGADMVPHTCISQTLTEGSAQPPERRDVTHSLTRLHSDLNFWRIRPLSISITSRHPLGIFDIVLCYPIPGVLKTFLMNLSLLHYE